MISNSILVGISKAAIAIEVNIAFKEHGTETHFRGFLQRIIKQEFTISLTLKLRCDTDRPHCKHFYIPAIVRVDNGPHEHVLAYQLAVLLHHKIELLHERRIISQNMQCIMLTTARLINVPERFSDKVLYFSVFSFLF